MLTQCLVALQNITKHNHTILYANPKRTAAAFPKSPDRVAVPRLLNLQEAYLVAPERFPNLPQVSKAGLFPQFSKKAADQLPAFGRPACLGKRLAHEKIVFVLYFVH